MVTATISPGEQRVLDATNALIRKSPRIVQDDTFNLLRNNGWWLKEADRHSTHGFYYGDENTILNLFGACHADGSTIDKAERRLEELLLRSRWLELCEKVKEIAPYRQDLFVSGRMGPQALLDGTYQNIVNSMQVITKNSGIDGHSTLSTDVLLPREIMRMNYPFSQLRANLPPRPSDLRVLCDWRVSFRSCFNEDYLTRKCDIPKHRDRMTYSYDSIDDLISDLAWGNYGITATATLNGSRDRIDFAVRQDNMNKKYWLIKAKRLSEHFGKSDPMLVDPLVLYNAARRAVRQTNSYLKRVADYFGAEYRTFPPKIEP